MPKTIPFMNINCTKCPLWHGMFSRLAAHAKLWRRSFPAKTIWMYQGDWPQTVGILRKGYMRLIRLNDNGRQIGLGLVRPGDIIGSLLDRPIDHMIESITPVELCEIDVKGFSRGIRADPAIRRNVLRNINEQLVRAQELLARRGCLSSRERIIGFLVDAVRNMPTESRLDGSLIVEICLPRQDWADLTDTSVETVSRTMTWLAERGDVQRLERDIYRIADSAGLVRMARLDVVPKSRRDELAGQVARRQ